MVEPHPAAVRPRVYVGRATEPTLLVDEVEARLSTGQTGLIQLAGQRRSGRTSALFHLAHVFVGEKRLLLCDAFDHFPSVHLQTVIPDRLIVACGMILPRVDETWQLAAWDLDEAIEYALARHPAGAADILRRVQQAPDLRLVADRPELWCAVLDELATDPRLTTVREALRRAATSQWSPEGELDEVRKLCCTVSATIDVIGLTKLQRRLTQYPIVQYLLGAEYLAERVAAGKADGWLKLRLPQPLIDETARHLRDNAAAERYLQRALVAWRPRRQSMAASLLHAAGHAVVVPANARLSLENASLARIAWRALTARILKISRADLARADLSNANLGAVCADEANLVQACLRGARIGRLDATRACLAGADLSNMHAVRAWFEQANLSGAKLEQSRLSSARFRNAQLAGASLCGAQLDQASFSFANLAGADFRESDLTAAWLSGLDLSQARWEGACLARAKLRSPVSLD